MVLQDIPSDDMNDSLVLGQRAPDISQMDINMETSILQHGPVQTPTSLLFNESRADFEQEPIACSTQNVDESANILDLDSHCIHANVDTFGLVEEVIAMEPESGNDTENVMSEEILSPSSNSNAPPRAAINVDKVQEISTPPDNALNELMTTSNLVKCSNCPKTFVNGSSLKRHIRRIHEGLSFRCPTCEKEFGSKYSLSQHVEAQHKDRTFDCEICPKTYKSKYGLQLHVKEHKGEANYVCHVCSETFVHKHYYDAHVFKHTGEALYPCSKCGKRFPTSSSQNHHQKTCGVKGKKFQCQICGKKFKTKRCMKEHKSSKHENPERYVCPQCGKLFSYRGSLFNHTKKCKK